LSVVDQLLAISSAAIISGPVADGLPLAEPFGALGAQLHQLLTRRNGFYAFESALHVFPVGAADGELDLSSWNAPDTWRSEFGDLARGCLFFAEDAFGLQFCLKGSDVCTFDAETGNTERLAGSLEEWVGRLLVDFQFLTGQPLAHDWQVSRGPLAPGYRLGPKIPFALGGGFEVANLNAVDQIELMRSRGSLARQIRDLPDGAKIRFVSGGRS
jgi:hypothetical protein